MKTKTQIKAATKATNIKVMIGTPAYGEMFFSPYVKSIVDLTRLFQKMRINFLLESISYAEISEARNYLVTRFYDKTDATHLLFIDADMGFSSQLIADMLALNKPLVGVVYPERQIDLKRVVEATKKGEEFGRSLNMGLDFILRPLPGIRHSVKNWFMQVAGCGGGVLLIERSCIKTMLRKIPDLSDDKTKSPLAKDLSRLIRVFDPVRVDEARLSEDYAFCHRWRDLCKGEVWVNIGHEITHVGLHHFKGRFAERVAPEAKLGETGAATRTPKIATDRIRTTIQPRQKAKVVIEQKQKTG